jgi:hypothetical protein
MRGVMPEDDVVLPETFFAKNEDTICAAEACDSGEIYKKGGLRAPFLCFFEEDCFTSFG